jgi:competence protein ComEA
MLKKILAILAMLYAAASFAAVDVNKATAADLDGIKGIGPVMSKRILDERKKGEFKSWEDLISRIKGIGDPTAAKFSAGGLTVGGAEYKRAALAKGDEKKSGKADAKADKKDDKAEKKEDKKDAKADKKEEKAVAKADKKDDKAAAAKPAASAAKK